MALCRSHRFHAGKSPKTSHLFDVHRGFNCCEVRRVDQAAICFYYTVVLARWSKTPRLDDWAWREIPLSVGIDEYGARDSRGMSGAQLEYLWRLSRSGWAEIDTNEDPISSDSSLQIRLPRRLPSCSSLSDNNRCWPLSRNKRSRDRG